MVLDSTTDRYLFSPIPGFERLVRHYPDDFRPNVASFLIDVSYEQRVRRGNQAAWQWHCKLPAERYRELSRTNGNFLSRRAGPLGRVVASYETLGLHKNARAALAEAIWVDQG